MVLQCYKDRTKRIFDSIDRNLFNEKIKFSFTKKYYEELHNIIVIIGTNLFREHGAFVLHFFLPMDQDRIRHARWDTQTEEPVPATKSMSGNIMEEETLED